MTLVLNGKDAIHAWKDAARKMNRPIPKPGELESQSGKWVQRVPKSIHLRLVNRAKAEGVSLNTLVITILAKSLAGEHLNQSNSRSIKKKYIYKKKQARENKS